jgi:DNA polymerase
VTHAERRAALDAIAAEVRVCTRCRLHESRTHAVPGEGHPDTEVMFVGEGPGFNEDRLGRPFVGRAGEFLVRLLGSIGWRREEVFITNIVKCRPPENRDPEPDEIAACAPYLRRQLEVLDPAVVVTLGRHSMGRFMPGARISQAHGTVRPADPATGARDATIFAMYHPAAALRTPAIAQESMRDMALVPDVLLEARERRARTVAPPPPSPESATGPDVGATVVVAGTAAAPETVRSPAAASSGAAAMLVAEPSLPVEAPVPAAAVERAPALAVLEPLVAGPPPTPDDGSPPSDQLSLF